MAGKYAHAWLKVASRWQMAKRLRAPGILAGELSERSRDKSCKEEKQRTDTAPDFSVFYDRESVHSPVCHPAGNAATPATRETVRDRTRAYGVALLQLAAEPSLPPCSQRDGQHRWRPPTSR